jgi:hypothetical protein
MANILHLAPNMEEELPGADIPAHDGPPSPISAFVAAGRGSHGGRSNLPVVIAEDVVCPASATAVAASPTSPRHVRRPTIPS